MPDTAGATIRIGGVVSAHLVGELKNHVASETWTTPIEPGHVLEVTDDTAIGGRFERLEAWLVEHGIDFDREGDGHYTWDGDRVKYRKGMDKPWSVPRDVEGKSFITEEDLMAILDRIPVGTVEEVKSVVADHFGHRIPDLEPLTITGWLRCPVCKSVQSIPAWDGAAEEIHRRPLPIAGALADGLDLPDNYPCPCCHVEVTPHVEEIAGPWVAAGLLLFADKTETAWYLVDIKDAGPSGEFRALAVLLGMNSQVLEVEDCSLEATWLLENCHRRLLTQAPEQVRTALGTTSGTTLTQVRELSAVEILRGDEFQLVQRPDGTVIMFMEDTASNELPFMGLAVKPGEGASPQLVVGYPILSKSRPVAWNSIEPTLRDALLGELGAMGFTPAEQELLLQRARKGGRRRRR